MNGLNAIAIQQEKERGKLFSLLGELPDFGPERIRAKTVSVEEYAAYTLEKLVLELNGIESVPAWFAKPRKTSGKIPVILYNHAHGGDYMRGNRELLQGASYLSTPCYGEALTARGYAVLSIDAWAFGERRGRTETQIFKSMYWNGQVLWGMMLFDSIRAIDYLFTREDIDPDRIATLGISMGGTKSWWLAALDTRIKVCIDMCSMADFHTLLELNGFDCHGFYYYVPRLLKHFTTARINALVAPRPHLSMNGIYDVLTPAAGFEKIDNEMKNVYAGCEGVGEWRMNNYSTGHYETAEMRAAALDFLEKWL
jgi:hypothetical protein